MFWYCFPIYLSYGMTSEEYWKGNPYLAPAYRKAEEYKFERMNNQAHLQGLYNFYAVDSSLGIFGWNLSGRKGSAPDLYSERPMAFTMHERRAEKKRSIEKTLRWVEEGQK